MGATNSSSQNIKFYSLKAKVSETEDPRFVLTEKINGTWQEAGRFDTMVGRLDSAEIKQKEFQGSKFNTFVITMSDDSGGTSKIEFTHNPITRSMINSLASNCNKQDTYKIQVYKKQSKGSNGKMYWNGCAAVRVEGNEALQSWFIDPQSAPKKEQVMVNGQPFMQQGKQVYDDSKLRTFWEDFFTKNIIGKLKCAPASNNTGVTRNDNPNPTYVTPVDDDMENLPF